MSDLRVNPVGIGRDLTAAARELGGAGAGDGVPFGKIFKGVLDDAVKAEQEAAASV